MIDKSHLDFDELSYIFIISNTPPFLFSRFSKNLSIEIFAKNNSSSDLSDNILMLIGKVERTINDYVLLYASAVALYFKEYFNWEELLNKISIDQFNFLYALIYFMAEKKVPTLHLTFNSNQTKIIYGSSLFSGDATDTSIILPFKNKLHIE